MTQPNQSELVESILSILGIVDRTSGNRPEQIATLEQELTAHTNDEIAKVLDRLEQGLPDTAFHGTSIRVKEKIRDGGYADGVRDSRLAIEAERNKLKEVK